MQYSAPEDPVQGTPVPSSRASGELRDAAGATSVASRETPSGNQPVVKSEWDKTPRNAPCPCGSGKKFKLCHGK